MPAIDTGDLTIHYEICGAGHPLLLIHGLGSSSRDWELQIPSFREYFRVIAMDLRGHGQSDKPPGPYSVDSFARDASRLLAEVAGAPSHVVGLSLGGMVAYQLALDYPNQVSKLVIVNSVPELIPRTLWDRLGYWQRLLTIRLLGLEGMGRVLAKRFFTGPDQEPLRQMFIRRWAENDPASYRASLRAIYGWSVRSRLGEIRSPTLLVGAEWDYFPTAEKAACAALIPDARLVMIKESHHALPVEKPAEFNQAVLDFLRSESPSSV